MFPQGSILGPLLFLLFINDIVNEIHVIIRFISDYTSLYLIVEHPDVTAQLLNIDLETLTKLDGWLRMGLLPLGNFADISYLVEN